jgi:hypothetical protein
MYLLYRPRAQKKNGTPTPLRKPYKYMNVLKKNSTVDSNRSLNIAG